MGASDYTENKLLDWISGTADMPTAASRYVSLHTADPTDAGTGTEVSGGSYARVDISSGAAFPAASGTGGSVSNDTDITFPTASGSWGTVTHWGIFDASTSGNCICSGALGSSVAPTTGNIVKFNTSTNQLTITVT